MSGVEVATFDDLPVDRGVAALVDDAQVAVFRMASGEVFAIDHIDPATGVGVLARGLVGSTGDVVYVASPLHKQRYDLRTGACLDDESLSVQVWPVSIADGVVTIEHAAASTRCA